MCNSVQGSWTRRSGKRHEGHYCDTCLHLSTYCGLENSILSMWNFPVLINVLRLYKNVFKHWIFKGKKMSQTYAQIVLKIYFYTHSAERKKVKKQI